MYTLKFQSDLSILMALKMDMVHMWHDIICTRCTLQKIKPSVAHIVIDYFKRKWMWTAAESYYLMQIHYVAPLSLKTGISCFKCHCSRLVTGVLLTQPQNGCHLCPICERQILKCSVWICIIFVHIHAKRKITLHSDNGMLSCGTTGPHLNVEV